MAIRCKPSPPVDFQQAATHGNYAGVQPKLDGRLLAFVQSVEVQQAHSGRSLDPVDLAGFFTVRCSVGVSVCEVPRT